MFFDSDFLKFLETMRIILKLNYISEFTGERAGKQRGSGMDFKDYRHYEIGDDYRYIDWNLYSRLEQLYLKEFIEEKGSSIFLMIDNSDSMSIGSPSKLEKAVQIAAALGYIGLIQMDRVAVAFFSDKLNSVSRLLGGKNQAHTLFSILEGVETAGKTDICKSISAFINSHKKPGLLVLLSDFICAEDFFQGIKILKIHGWRVLLIHILAEEDINPRLEENLNLLDVETNEKKEIYIDEELLDNYQKNIGEYYKYIDDSVKKFSLAYIRTDTGRDLKEIICRLLGPGREIK
ncbi:MAG: DUF58 domain-containing protein [Halanaerobiaceae bacterium]|jgi:uncharacterized protein (DUF58 family)|nr:DUF58 domain-containing protein [Halanaerobiaceae bacterium]